MNHRIESAEHYQQALKSGRKSHRQDTQAFLPALDKILQDHMTAGAVKLGLLQLDAVIAAASLHRDRALRHTRKL